MAFERLRLRRRLDRQERAREALLLDLGAIIFELHRQRRREPELLRAKAAALTAIDDEVRELSEALGEGHSLAELTARGLVATCTSCAAIMGVRDRHCPACGSAAGEVTALNGADPHGETQDVPALAEALEEAKAPADSEDGGQQTTEWKPPWMDQSEEAEERSEPRQPVEPPTFANGSSPEVTHAPDALVPRAQRTLRAGRRRARAWLAERRSEAP